jgi:glycosyltransferase involved in cell wall biosynthesis
MGLGIKTRVDIGMPVYNGENFIEASIKSNLEQTYGDFTLFIADNASTDRTEEICRDYAAVDKRIVYIRNQKNLGAARNYSVCFTPSQSEYFRWSNSDDLIEPTLIERCINFLDDHPDYILVYGKTNLIDLSGKFLEHYEDKLDLPDDSATKRFKKFLANIRLNNVLYGLMRRQPLSRTALLKNYSASDINLVGELSLYGKFHELDSYLFKRRMHPDACGWNVADNEKQKEFWDPGKKSHGLNVFRSFYEYYKAILRAPISMTEKMQLLVVISKSAYWSKERLIQDLKNYQI